MPINLTITLAYKPWAMTKLAQPPAPGLKIFPNLPLGLKKNNTLHPAPWRPPRAPKKNPPGALATTPGPQKNPPGPWPYFCPKTIGADLEFKKPSPQKKTKISPPWPIGQSRAKIAPGRLWEALKARFYGARPGRGSTAWLGPFKGPWPLTTSPG
jgi:hypothetical protein